MDLWIWFAWNASAEEGRAAFGFVTTSVANFVNHTQSSVWRLLGMVKPFMEILVSVMHALWHVKQNVLAWQRKT